MKASRLMKASRWVRSRLVASLATVALVASPAMAGEEKTPEADFVLGQKLVGSLTAGATDTFTFYAVAGTRLTFTAKANGSGNTLAPLFTVTGPEGEIVVAEEDSATSKPTLATVKKVVTPSTGLHAFTIRGASGSGPYAVKTRGRMPKPISPVVMIDESGAVACFDGVPGMVLRSLQIRALAPKGKYATLFTTPVQPGITSIDACGTPLDIEDDVTESKSGLTVKLKDIELTEACEYEVHLEQTGTAAGFARVKTKLRMPKGKGVVTDAPPEPPE